MRARAMTKGFVWMIAALLTILAWTPWCGGEILVYPMQYRPAAEALPSVQTLLSKEGRAAADPRTNALLIDDNEDAIKRIREFLASFDQLGKQARIRVKFIEAGSSDSSAVSADARASGSGWVITTDPRKRSDGVEVSVQGREREKLGTSEYFVNVVSGSSAYIMVGKDILYNQRWIDLTRRYGRAVDAVTIQRIETGFEALPVILKDHVDIQITPRISHEASSRPGGGVIRFSELSTHLYAPLNQWITIGGADQSSNEVMREIFASGSRRQGSSVTIQLMVEPE